MHLGSALFTDEMGGYKGLHGEYQHQIIDHAIQNVNGRIHTNGMRNSGSLLKRRLGGTYVSVELFHYILSEHLNRVSPAGYLFGGGLNLGITLWALSPFRPPLGEHICLPFFLWSQLPRSRMIDWSELLSSLRPQHVTSDSPPLQVRDERISSSNQAAAPRDQYHETVLASPMPTPPPGPET